MFSVVGAGYLLLKYTVPDEKQLYERLSPEQKKEVDKRRESKNADRAILLDFIKSNADSDRPAWDVQIPPHVQQAMDRLNQKPAPASYPRGPPPSAVPKP
ncbi:hypothetical protein DSO57_1023703 [Entomophthora muscae]|uniref:Uncharacterized protein n=1 Tax=Entomophthora muscae TaxID=34485 RepID=A0ACC2TDK8_9FUNG|nr:hypothetical protein DSO57_1023703 [Entomophthora muscae]